MKKSNKYKQFCKEVDSVFSTCVWIEEEGKSILAELDKIKDLPWSKELESTKNSLIKKLKFLINKSKIEEDIIQKLSHKIDEEEKKNAKN
jgi:hypothetical protein